MKYLHGHCYRAIQTELFLATEKEEPMRLFHSKLRLMAETKGKIPQATTESG